MKKIKFANKWVLVGIVLLLLGIFFLIVGAIYYGAEQKNGIYDRTAADVGYGLTLVIIGRTNKLWSTFLGLMITGGVLGGLGFIILFVGAFKLALQNADSYKSFFRSIVYTESDDVSKPSKTIRCHKCGTLVSTGLDFCTSCGAEVTNICPSCGFNNSLKAVYCGKCGTRVKESEEDDADRIAKAFQSHIEEEPDEVDNGLDSGEVETSEEGDENPEN